MCSFRSAKIRIIRVIRVPFLSDSVITEIGGFEWIPRYDYYLETPLNHESLETIRVIGEFRGREILYKNQTPEVLENLRKTAIIQSAESSNRIEGIEVAPGRIDSLVLKQSKPVDRSEQEIAGYRPARPSAIRL
jgi:hypothetical protein